MTVHSAILWGLCGLVAFLPLPFGSTEEWALAVFQVAVFALFGAHVFSRKRDEPARVPLIMKIALAVFFAVTIIQMAPLPPAFVKVISPRAYAAYVQVGAVAGPGADRGWMTLSLSPAATEYELLKYICFFLFGFLVYSHVRTRRETKIFVLALVGTAVLEAFYGLIELFGGAGSVFGVERTYDIESATGTFINRDHFSGFLEMALPVALGYLLARANFFSFRKGSSLKDKILWFSQERLQKTIVIGVAAVVIGLGIVFSRSRTGIFIFCATIFLMIAALSASAGVGAKGASGGRGRRFARALRTVSLLVVFAAVLIGIRPVIERFSWAHLKSEERPVFYVNTVSLIGGFPLVGTGPGTFVDAYQAFEKKTTLGLVNHAHNDYLEIVAESGLVGGGVLVLLALGSWAFLLARWVARRDNFDRGIVLGCVLGILAILVHSLTDFNLRVPSNAAVFAALYGLALRKTLDRRDGREGKDA